MMRNLSKCKLLIPAVLSFITVLNVSGQGMKVGDNPTIVNPNSILELESTNKGFVAPRVALTGTTSATPLSASPALLTGTIVYNTASAGSGSTAVSPGYYYWDGSMWQRILASAQSISATGPLQYSSGTGVLSITQASGSTDGYLSSTDWTTFNSKEAAITAGTSGQYWRGDKTWQALDKTAVGLPNVENTALSTWAGSTNLNTLGTITTGTWNAGIIGPAYGGTGLNTSATAAGSLLYTSAAGTWNTLAAGTSGQVLAVNGSGIPTWVTGATGSVGSVDVSGGTTGLTTSGGPITTSGTITLGGTLGVANGGTGLTSGTSGGVPYYSASGTMASSAALAADQLVVGGGAGAAPKTLAAGSNNQVLTMVSGIPAWSAPATGNLINVITFTSGSGTYTPSAGTTAIKVTCVGGGGAGAGVAAISSNGAAAGGGGASGAVVDVYMSTIATTYTYSIGSGGVGSSAAAGGNGNATTFARATGPTTLSISAPGGLGGSLMTASGNIAASAGGDGQSGTVSGSVGADVIGSGAPGGYSLTNPVTGSAIGYAISGVGGSTSFGGGGIVKLLVGSSIIGSAAGANGTGYGAGGSGAYGYRSTTGTAAAQAGGNGSGGIVVLYEYK